VPKARKTQPSAVRFEPGSSPTGGGRASHQTSATCRPKGSRLEAVAGAGLLSDHSLHEVDDVAGRLVRVVLGKHVAFVAAARLARHEPEHPATPAAAAAAASDVSKTIFAKTKTDTASFRKFNRLVKLY